MKPLNFWNDKENCFKESLKYDNVAELQRANYGCYMGLSRNGWLYEAFPSKKEKKPIGYWNSLENCIEESRKHNSLTRMKVESHGCYVSVKKHGWENKMEFNDKRYSVPRNAEQKPSGYWDIKKNCLNESKKFATVYDLQRESYGCYMGLKRNKWLECAFPPKDGIKPMNYWNDKDRVFEAAKKCQTKMEFKRRFGGAFNAAIRNNWMEEISKGFEKNINYIDLKKRIHGVYVYEIEKFNSCYVGRTTNLHSRDLSHRRGRKRHDKTITYDVLYSFCNKNNIPIPPPIIKETNLNGEESLIKEDYWVKKYKEDGWNVLNVSKTGRLSGSLGAIKKWDYETCKEFSKNYTYKTELKKANYSCYATCLKNGWFEEFGIKDKKSHPNGNWNIKYNCLEEAKKYSSKSKFITESMGAYRGAKKHNWLDEVYAIIEENAKNNNDDESLAIVQEA